MITPGCYPGVMLLMPATQPVAREPDPSVPTMSLTDGGSRALAVTARRQTLSPRGAW